MSHPERKQNRLMGYDTSQNGAYFITVCVKDRAEILWRSVGADAHIGPANIMPLVELSWYGQVTEKYLKRIKGIEKYVVMPNHIHCIIRIDREEQGPMWASAPTIQSIPQLIKSFKTLVTKEIGFPIFQRSYHDHIIRNEREYEKIWNYIDGNPLCWEKDCFYPGN